MNLQRTFALVHLLDIPESKRKFWPQWSTVVVSKDGAVEDVIQYFEEPKGSLHRSHMELYPKSVQFTVKAGESFLTLASLKEKVAECVWAHQNY